MMAPKPKKTTGSSGKNRGVENLRPFKPGQSGNPSGRPKGSVSITKHLIAALEAQDEQQAKMLAQAIIIHAAKGNGAALKCVMDRIDGPVKEQLELTGKDGGPISVEHEHFNYDNLTREEARELEKILRSAHSRRAAEMVSDKQP